MSKKRTPLYSTIRFKKEIADQIREIAKEEGRKVEVAAERLMNTAIADWKNIARQEINKQYETGKENANE